ncbi:MULTISPECIES: hypothetical protein [unclassified Mesorhizobium]|uniref:hypothetical protein n=1 Tax=unclassified Mesorhizobium TaxID=325217 RepID=UPI00112D28C9|nr:MULTISPECIES: hypothetical protein [unclassified Mesorhizobium]TPK53799.1 hypothetical protein FJ550_09365 [Mesorhizobium sp. B2-5-2]TPL17192.1 hypothetical protein FJ946_28915 [Mesorhizobium sp. B2-4-7]TPL33397.1 hypothetical protein FJ961_28765 [Mesorhizobium sp. B2-4-5]TPM68067.1 hypothetical protein FJ968_30030 [Mesorhizobium sp. B2-1-6]TPN73649.1 hypothetical protein FJ985_25860 [Mesorhizobium sp. B1-1-2]
MIGKAFIDPETERIYHVTGVIPTYEDIGALEGALIITRDDLEARLVSSFQADKLEGQLAVRVEVIIRAGQYRYPAGTPFVLYRVADWKSGKVWATPLRQFHRQFQPLDGDFIGAVPIDPGAAE